jgi:hypothetical protein
MLFKNNKRQEGKIGLFQGWAPRRGGIHQERVNEGEYGRCILYPHMKIKE